MFADLDSLEMGYVLTRNKNIYLTTNLIIHLFKITLIHTYLQSSFTYLNNKHNLR